MKNIFKILFIFTLVIFLFSYIWNYFYDLNTVMNHKRVADIAVKFSQIIISKNNDNEELINLKKTLNAMRNAMDKDVRKMIIQKYSEERYFDNMIDEHDNISDIKHFADVEKEFGLLYGLAYTAIYLRMRSERNITMVRIQYLSGVGIGIFGVLWLLFYLRKREEKIVEKI